MSKAAIISKIFNQAKDEERLGNPDAAKTFTAKALSMCAKYGVSEAEARQGMTDQEKKDSLIVGVNDFCAPRQHGASVRANSIGTIVQEIFTVKVVFKHDYTSIRFFGPENQVEQAKRVAESLIEQVEESAKWGRKEYKKNPMVNPYTGKKVRFSIAAFEQGFFTTVFELAKKIAVERDNALSVESSKGDALALREMREEVEKFYKENSGRVRSSRANRNSLAGFHQGVEAGQKASLSENKAIGA